MLICGSVTEVLFQQKWKHKIDEHHHISTKNYDLAPIRCLISLPNQSFHMDFDLSGTIKIAGWMRRDECKVMCSQSPIRTPMLLSQLQQRYIIVRTQYNGCNSQAKKKFTQPARRVGIDSKWKGDKIISRKITKWVWSEQTLARAHTHTHRWKKRTAHAELSAVLLPLPFDFVKCARSISLVSFYSFVGTSHTHTLTHTHNRSAPVCKRVGTRKKVIKHFEQYSYIYSNSSEAYEPKGINTTKGISHNARAQIAI